MLAGHSTQLPAGRWPPAPARVVTTRRRRTYGHCVPARLIVSLDRRLITSLKRRAVDSELSLSELVTRIFSGYLGEWQDESPAADDVTSDDPQADDWSSEPGVDAPELVLQPLVHVTDVAGTVRLLEVLGGQVVQDSRAGDWVQVAVGGAEVGLLAHPPNPDQGDDLVELAFASRGPVTDLESRARSGGVEVSGPSADQGFGRQLQLRTPDGLLVTINEIDAELIG